MSVALTAAPIQAATALRPSGSDTLTLELANGTSFVYAGQPGGTPAPRFTATLVLAAPPTGNYFMQVIVSVAGTNVGNGSPPTQNGLTYIFTIDSNGTTLPAGAQTAVATFYNASTNTTDQSNPVAFTITRATPQLRCTINNYAFVNDPGQTLQVHMSFDGENPNAPVDWQNNATYQITFVDTANDTFPSGTLTPDSQDVVTIQTPPRYDWYYRIDCTFSGTANFAPVTAQAADQPVLVSAKHPVGHGRFHQCSLAPGCRPSGPGADRRPSHPRRPGAKRLRQHPPRLYFYTVRSPRCQRRAGGDPPTAGTGQSRRPSGALRGLPR
jgi:hypothetical protein